jgi:hypothetical protein
VSQPHFEGSARSPFTLSKMGLGSPSGLPKTQSAIVGVKTPCIEVFLCRWKGLEVYMSKMASHEPFGRLQHKLWLKERPGVKLAVWIPTTKNRESTQSRCVQVKCDTPLESSWRPRPNQSSGGEVMNAQNPRSQNWDNFETPLWESWKKVPFGCECDGETQRILYEGRWWLPPSPGRGESSGSKVAHG